MKKGVMIIRRPNLTDAQKPLFALICDKLCKGDKLTMPEIKQIYIKYACREVRNGVPYFWDYWKNYDYINKKSVGGWVKRPDKHLNQLVTMWLMNNIGSLVLKGYLKVLPIIELKIK